MLYLASISLKLKIHSVSVHHHSVTDSVENSDLIIRLPAVLLIHIVAVEQCGSV